jgi:hypothetical protein
MLPDELTHYLLLENKVLFHSHLFCSPLMLTIISYHSFLSLAGQITQWNLIFYGTSETPQKNDPPRYLGNNKKTVVNDLIHNSLDNSQWGFITQDVSKVTT